VCHQPVDQETTEETFKIVSFKYLSSSIFSILLLVRNCNKHVLLMFKDKKLALNHKFILDRVLYSAVVSSSRLEQVIMVLVSSAKSTIIEFIPASKGKSFIYIRNNKGLKTEPCVMLNKMKAWLNWHQECDNYGTSWAGILYTYIYTYMYTSTDCLLCLPIVKMKFD